jgi:2-keto-4-pentenoate hydratase/2-oxohepta-3-ene-1,7-dioic acid hydratase in catechol pathway
MPHFAKYHNAVTAHGKPVIYPKIVRQLDLEGELTAVIGKRAYHVEEHEALDYVAGYTIMNDVSARCLQAQGLLTISKGYETFCPMGPWLVTTDEIPDPQNLAVRTYLNDLEVCTAHTSEMLFTIAQFIAPRSRACSRSNRATCWRRAPDPPHITTRRSSRRSAMDAGRNREIGVH